MKRLFAILAMTALAACGQSIQTTQSTIEAAPLTLVPYPQQVERQPGTLALADGIVLDTNPATPKANRAIRELLQTLEVEVTDNAAGQIELFLVNEPALGEEGYRLTIGESITLSAQTDTGLFYAVQTLRQLLPATPDAPYELARLTITDHPGYEWRGNMLDVARSFLPVDYLKQHIDRLALFKMNKLHLHLSDDQGWRVQIKQYPKLTEIGGASAVEGGRSGYYTQEQLKDLVAYAQARGVTIVPEVDLPGHTQAAIASYNELACDDVTNLTTYSGLEVGFSKLCLTEPQTIYPFVQNVLEELVAIFPSQYIHIGGDEIKDPLYPEFIARATAMVDELGRTAIAWEEGSVADNDPDVLLQLWNDEYNIQPALDRGHQLILSPCSYTYFDHGNYAGQPNTYDWCRKEGVTLERAYSFNPQAYTQAVGVESAMWSELVHTNAAADSRLWPRLAATAETAWTPAGRRDYSDFLKRLKGLRAHLDAMGVDYYAEPDLGWQPWDQQPWQIQPARRPTARLA